MPIYILVCIFNMLYFKPSESHLRKILLFLFHLKKTAVRAHRSITRIYGEHVISLRTCEYWFSRFEDGNFNTNYRKRKRRATGFRDAELKALLNRNPIQKEQEVAKSLEITCYEASLRMKCMKRCGWIPRSKSILPRNKRL